MEAEFEREVKELQATVQALPEQYPAGESLTPEKQTLLQLAQINPRSAVLEAWRGVETAASGAVSSKALHVRERDAHSPLAVIRALTKENVLLGEQVSLFYELRALRNQAAHAPDFAPTTDAAVSYIELAERLRSALEEAAK